MGIPDVFTARSSRVSTSNKASSPLTLISSYPGNIWNTAIGGSGQNSTSWMQSMFTKYLDSFRNLAMRPLALLGTEKNYYGLHTPVFRGFLFLPVYFSCIRPLFDEQRKVGWDGCSTEEIHPIVSSWFKDETCRFQTAVACQTMTQYLSSYTQWILQEISWSFLTTWYYGDNWIVSTYEKS